MKARAWIIFGVIVLVIVVVVVIATKRPMLASEPGVLENTLEAFRYQETSKAKIEVKGRTVQVQALKKDDQIVYLRDGLMVAYKEGKVICQSPGGLDSFTTFWVTNKAVEEADVPKGKANVKIRFDGKVYTITCKRTK